MIRARVLGLLAALVSTAALAHTGSTAYWQAMLVGKDVELRIDVALSDLDDAYGIDANNDGALTWGEVQAAAGTLQATMLQNISIRADDAPCRLGGSLPLAMADHSDGPYVVFRTRAQCPAIPKNLQLSNHWLFGFDANHRALVRLTRGDRTDSGVFSPAQTSLVFAATRGPWRVFADYWREGLHHVWSGWDHMLFLAGLFLGAALLRRDGQWQPVNRLRDAVLPAIKLVTAFTVAHAITLCLAALGAIHPPSRWVESLVAFSVFFAGFNNLLPIAGPRALFALAWGFGLIHGAAIASALQELGLPASGRVLALLGFNLGVESAQLTLVATVVPAAAALRHWRGYIPCVLWPGSVLVALAGLIWMIDRLFVLHWPLPI